MLFSSQVAFHRVLRVEVNQACLTIIGLLVALLRQPSLSDCGSMAEAEACGQTEALHLGQGLVIHCIAVNLTLIFDLKIR